MWQLQSTYPPPILQIYHHTPQVDKAIILQPPDKLCVTGMQSARLLSDMRFHCMQVQLRMWMRMHIESRKGREGKGCCGFGEREGWSSRGWWCFYYFVQVRVQDLLQITTALYEYSALRLRTCTLCLDIWLAVSEFLHAGAQCLPKFSITIYISVNKSPSQYLISTSNQLWQSCFNNKKKKDGYGDRP